MRWGKTMGAYDKFKSMFEQELPVTIPSNAPMSDASYIRDVILYAKENGLTGGDWSGKVYVSPQEDMTVVIKAKPIFADELGSVVYPSNTVFSILKQIEENKISNGFRCEILDSYATVTEAVSDLGFTIRKLGGNIVEFVRSDKDE